MGRFRSFTCVFYLAVILSLIFQPFVQGYIIPRSNDTAASNNTTFATGDIGVPLKLTRENYDQTVSRWKAGNPHLADGISSDAIETVWSHISGDVVSKRRNRSATQKEKPLYKRQNSTQADLDAARTLINAVVAEIGQQNSYSKANPRRNTNTARPINGTSIKMRSSDNSSFVVNSTIAAAAALVAEADAQQLASNGSLLRDYTLTGKYAKYNKPGFPTGSKLKKRDDYYWLEDFASQYPGKFPFGNDAEYEVYRNVMDYGAKGDGVTDDTAAINAAIAAGSRCGTNCGSSSVKGALVYFPSGTYLVSTPIISLYNTQLVGNVNDYPVILAAPAFIGLGVITSDVYLGGTAEYYINTNNFLRQIRNFVINMQSCNTAGVAGIHWQVAQATSLQNLYIVMTDSSTSTQIGVFSENGSGGFMSDLIFLGGYIGLQCGNQQFTTRNLVFLSETYAISMLWDWGWTWKSLDVLDCTFGIYFETTDVGGSIYVLDSIFTNVVAAIVIDSPAGSTIYEQILISVNNMVLSAVTDAIVVLNPTVIVLAGGSTTITSWVLGPVYDTAHPSGSWFEGVSLDSLPPQSATLGGGPNGGYFEQSKPSYATTTSSNWLSASLVATGDGSTDDTASLSFMFALGADLGYGIFVPTGSYIIASPPLTIPINSVIVGACWSQFVAYGDSYNNMNDPVPMVKVGNAGDVGKVEIQDILFTVKGPTQGAILVEWNAFQGARGSVAMWDCHFRVGGALGTNLQAANCPVGSNNKACIAASLGLHITSGGSGYFENMWVWTADHDMDSGVAQTQVNVFSGRGILIESQGPVWLYGTASEHSVLYQYNLAGASNIYMGMIQTESPYYAPFVMAPAPFTSSLQVFLYDPAFADCNGGFPCAAAWALTITDSNNIQMTGAGLYSWFDNYNEACVDTQNCQQRLAATQNNGNIYLFNVYTIGSIGMVHDFIETIGTDVSSTLALALSASNTVETSHPFLAAIVAWVEIFPDWNSANGDGSGGSKSVGSGSAGTSGICSIPDVDLANAATLAADKKISSTLYYFLTTTEGGKNSNWAHDLWAIDDSTQNCGEVTGSGCYPAKPCTEMTNPSDWWIENTIANWNSYMVSYYEAWGPTVWNVTNMVNAIALAFPIDVPASKIPGAATFLSNFGAALSIVGGGLGGLDNPLAGVVIGSVGAIISDAAANLGTDNPSPTLTLEAVLQSRLSQVFTGITTSISKATLAFIDNGDVSGWGTTEFTGPYAGENSVVAFFDSGHFFFSPTDAGFDISSLTEDITAVLQQNIAGMALNAANWYILRNAYTAADCAGQPTGMLMASDSNYCYTLEQPGEGYSGNFEPNNRAQWSVGMTSDTLKSLTDLGVNLVDLYTSSWNCELGAGAYDALGDFTYDALTFTTTIPTCFYNVPVLSVLPEDDDIFNSTPCDIIRNNVTTKVQAVGVTYMPDNLYSIFGENDFCCVLEGAGAVVCASQLT